MSPRAPVKMLGHADRLLAGGRVADEQNFLGLEVFLQAPEFLARAVRRFPGGPRYRKSGRHRRLSAQARALASPSALRTSVSPALGLKNGHADLVAEGGSWAMRGRCVTAGDETRGAAWVRASGRAWRTRSFCRRSLGRPSRMRAGLSRFSGASLRPAGR